MADAAESPQVMDRRLLAIPGLIRRHCVQRLRGGAVQEINHGVHSLPPEPPRDTLCLHHAAGNGDHGLIAALDDPILLGQIGSRQLSVNTVARHVLAELDRCELSALVCVQCLQLAPALYLHAGLEVLDGCCCLVLAGDQGEPHKATHIVDQQKKIPLAPRCSRLDRSADVTMDQFQVFFGLVDGLLRERRPLLLPNQARVAELVDMIDRRKTVNHGLSREAAKCLEVDVPVAHMLEPARLTAAL
jgi:hypothetical protein